MFIPPVAERPLSLRSCRYFSGIASPGFHESGPGPPLVVPWFSPLCKRRICCSVSGWSGLPQPNKRRNGVPARIASTMRQVSRLRRGFFSGMSMMRCIVATEIAKSDCDSVWFRCLFEKLKMKFGKLKGTGGFLSESSAFVALTRQRPEDVTKTIG